MTDSERLAAEADGYVMQCRAQVVLAAVQSPLLGDRKRASLLIPRICNIILNAPNSCRHVRLCPHPHQETTHLFQAQKEKCLIKGMASSILEVNP